MHGVDGSRYRWPWAKDALPHGLVTSPTCWRVAAIHQIKQSSSNVIFGSGNYAFLFAVWIGATSMPGRVDMLVLLISPFAAFSLFFQPPILIQAAIALIVWTINYRTAAFLSALSGKSYRCKWDPRVPLPDIDGATYMHKKWAARPLFRVGTNMVRGIRVNNEIMLEADAPITFTFSEE